MEFSDYIEALNLLEINVIIRANSTISIGRALNIVRDRVNKNADKYDVDVKAKMTDFRNGNIYEVFSDKWLDKYDQTDWWNLQLDNVSIQKMLSKNTLVNDILIDSKDGTVHIDTTNGNYIVLVESIDHLTAISKIENKKDDGFDIVLYDNSEWAENKVKLDCSENQVEVMYAIIYK